MTIKCLQKLFNKIKSPKEKVRLPYIEVDIVEHCNLKCKACSHFANIAEEIFMDVQIFKNDMENLAKKFEFDTIRLLGGEPLLHYDINKFMEITRKIFPETTIYIVTNGILLLKKDPSFWETAVKNNISIEVSKYPINNEIYKQAFSLINKYKIRYEYIDKKYFCCFFNPKGNYNLKKAYKMCKIKTCTTLRNGKIYLCPLASSLKHYNKYFNTNLEEEKGIDIYNNSAQKIIKYINKPIKTCKYCTWGGEIPYNSAKYINWNTSKKDKNEWF